MPVASSRRTWGAVRKLPSGRYQAKFRVHGVWKTAPTTYTTKRDADAYLAATHADLERGTWHDPEAGRVMLRRYAEVWLEQRPNLRPRTREQYEANLRLHILPTMGEIEIGRIAPGTVRAWHSGLLNAGKPGPPTVAKCYRLLNAMMVTAVADELIIKNPCLIKGASTDKAPERPVASLEQVARLADAVSPRFQRAPRNSGCPLK